ncbi:MULTISPECIES: ABC transporter ATP-binding protein [Paenibacillus]|uniref:ABC transporter ATP-binding protein n=1 Tax=Paenibacillus TaxID=44249 RepID=UPI000B7FC2CC|nr:ABC transporter ATP-binding protein [Paenibacillus sp. SSG-1]OXL86112.1 multidrug ABC transporter ATP-binding protein [Paenibacillus sp. SSG-1]
MEQPIIRMEGVTKQRRHKTIGPIDLTLPKGYVYGLIGENGSGKSTLIHMLLQTVFPDSGRISWFGHAYSKGIPMEVRRSIGYVAEKSNLEEDNLTAEEAAAFRAYWYPEWDQPYFEKLCDLFQVPKATRLRKMSKGERRKYEIAAALAPHPKLLLLDEPSSGLDPFAWKMMIEVLRECLQTEDTTIVLSTHIIDEVKRLADYVMLIHHGKWMGMAEKDSLLDNWKEVWAGCPEADLEELPNMVQTQQESHGVTRVVTTSCRELEQILYDSGINVLKTRALELDEILTLWVQGYKPAGVQEGEEQTHGTIKTS